MPKYLNSGVSFCLPGKIFINKYGIPQMVSIATAKRLLFTRNSCIYASAIIAITGFRILCRPTHQMVYWTSFLAGRKRIVRTLSRGGIFSKKLQFQDSLMVYWPVEHTHSSSRGIRAKPANTLSDHKRRSWLRGFLPLTSLVQGWEEMSGCWGKVLQWTIIHPHPKRRKDRTLAHSVGKKDFQMVKCCKIQ